MTPLFSPNGTAANHPAQTATFLRPPALDAPAVVLAPAPKGRRLSRLARMLDEDGNPEDDDDDEVDDEARDPTLVMHAHATHATHATPGSASRPAARPRPEKWRQDENDDDDDEEFGVRHKPASKPRKPAGPRGAETAEDMMRREGHVCQALQVWALTGMLSHA